MDGTRDANQTGPVPNQVTRKGNVIQDLCQSASSWAGLFDPPCFFLRRPLFPAKTLVFPSYSLSYASQALSRLPCSSPSTTYLSP